MNREPLNPQQGVDGYEGNLRKSYGELGLTGHGIERWGDVEVDGKWLNCYTSSEFIDASITTSIVKHVAGEGARAINLADIGGGDGYLLDTVAKQMDAAGVEINCATNVDLDPSGKALAKMQERIHEGSYRSDLHMVQADALQGIPLQPGSQDVAISRFVIQYLPAAMHMTFIRNIMDTVKPGGMMLMQYPTHKDIVPFGELMRKVSNIVSGESGFQRDYPSLEAFAESRQELEQMNVSLESSGAVCQWLFSAEAWGDRFHLNANRIDQIREEYRLANEQTPGLCIEQEGHLCLDCILAEVIMKKNK